MRSNRLVVIIIILNDPRQIFVRYSVFQYYNINVTALNNLKRYVLSSKMEKLPMCRICLMEDVRMYVVVNRNLHELYEKLTDIPFVTEDSRPILACFICCTKLKQCCRLLRQCLEAEEQFAQMMNQDYKPNPLVNQDRLEIFSGFIKSPMVHVSIVDECQTESIAIKEELPAVCEGLDDIIEPKEEHHSDELKLENVDCSCLDVADIPLQHSESDLEDDVPLMDFKSEVVEEEVSKKKRRARETERTTFAKKPKLDTGRAKLEEAIITEKTIKEKSDSKVSWTTQKRIDLYDTDEEDEEIDRLTLDDEINPCLLPFVQEVSVTTTDMTEPICDIDLTTFQAEVLQSEDAANDQAIRDILPDDCYTFTWSKDRETFLGRRETFTGTAGPTFNVTDRTRPTDIYDSMIDYNFIDSLCRETNRFADQKIALLRRQNKLTPHSRFNHWSPTNRDEMVSFLAIQILQGLYPLPDEESYFKYNGYGTTPFFAKIITYDRFLLLKSFLHFVDSETLPDTTRLSKIRPMIDYFNTKFSSLYMPSQEIAIEESLLKWHGKLSFVQKITSKAAQVGVKIYELCESSSGYLWRFFIYTGKPKPTTTTDNTAGRNTQPDEQIDDQTDDEPDEGTDRITTGDSVVRPATAKIVHDLVEPLLHRGHTLIMDNFYNSPLLLRNLKRQKTDCYGTLRLNREFVPESVQTLTKTDLRRGEVVATYCSDLSIQVWRDSNIVSMISTYHKLQIGTHEKDNRVTYKPKIVLDYDKSMAGVDRKDQFLLAQPMERLRNRDWYKKLFRRLYNAAIFNCFVIFSSVHRKISHRQFRVVLAEDLVKRHRQLDILTEYRRLNTRSNSTGQVMQVRQPRNDRPRTQARPMLEHNHFPIKTGSRYTVCCVCRVKTRTAWKCEECNVNLCIIGCFKAYHKV